MKKKFLMFFLAICFFIPCAIVMTACGSEPPKMVEIDWGLINNAYNETENMDSYVNGKSVNGQHAYVEVGATLKIELTMKAPGKYSEEDVVVTEIDDKELTTTIEVTDKSPVQSLITITISNIQEYVWVHINVLDPDETYEVSVPVAYNYDITYSTDSGDMDATELETDFYDIGIWSDKGQSFVTYRDILKYNKFLEDYELSSREEAILTYNELKVLEEGQTGYVENFVNIYADPAKAQLGLENIDASDFKVYVNFPANIVKFNLDCLQKLVVLRDLNGVVDDVELTFDPMLITKAGAPCYAYTLETDDVDLVKESSVITLNYEKDLGYKSEEVTTEELKEDAGYINTEGFKIQYESTCTLTNGYKFGFYIDTIQYEGEDEEPYFTSTLKDTSKSATIVINPFESYDNGHDYSYIDFSKFNVYVGNTSLGIKATYHATYNDKQNVFVATIPANKYPSEYGNAEKFIITAVPGVTDLHQMINSDYSLIPVVTKVADLAMHSVINTENYIDFVWTKTLSADQKTLTEYRIVPNNELSIWEEEGRRVYISISKEFSYSIYEDITVELTINGQTIKLLLDFGDILACFEDAQTAIYGAYFHYNEAEQTYTFDASSEEKSTSCYVYMNFSDFDATVTFERVYLPTSVAYDGNGIELNVTAATVGTILVKEYSYYEVDSAKTEVPTELTLKLNGEEVQPVELLGGYVLAKGVTYNFEFTLQDVENRSPMPSFITYIGTAVAEAAGIDLDYDYEVVGNKLVGTFCLKNSLAMLSIETHHYDLLSYLSFGVYYW